MIESIKADIKQLLEVSRVMGSGKRAILLFILYGKPMSYTEIDRNFKKFDIKIGSSEIYKHLQILCNNRYIAKKGKIYLVTLKGKKLIDVLQELIDVPPKVPKIELIF